MSRRIWHVICITGAGEKVLKLRKQFTWFRAGFENSLPGFRNNLPGVDLIWKQPAWLYPGVDNTTFLVLERTSFWRQPTWFRPGFGNSLNLSKCAGDSHPALYLWGHLGWPPTRSKDRSSGGRTRCSHIYLKCYYHAGFGAEEMEPSMQRFAGNSIFHLITSFLMIMYTFKLWVRWLYTSM